MRLSRREWLATVPAVGCIAQTIAAEGDEAEARRRGRDLQGEFGITTGSFMRFLRSPSAQNRFDLLQLPRIMREELDMRVIDLMTATLRYTDNSYCEQLRTAAEKAGCVITNLKMNLTGMDVGSANDELRQRSLKAFQRAIDAAQLLGCRWVRPATTPNKPEFTRLIDGLRQLVDYAGERQITLLVENNGWIQREVDALPRIVAALENRVATQPDTGNWQEAARYEGLAKAFPLAVTCDFKALELGANGEHAAYDLRRCFDTAWQAGFRGPWCFEHFHDDLAQLFREFKWLRTTLAAWTKENTAKDSTK